MISIFAKPAFLNVNPGQPFIYKGVKPKAGHVQRVSSMIRGDQIADNIGARLNPESGYENDVTIYVKPYVRKGNDFKFEGKKAYLDIIDGHNLGNLAMAHPEVSVIVCSQSDHEIMRGVITNEIVVIPQHHCNFENVQRERNGVTRIGMIGTRGAWDFLPENLEEELSKRGIELLKFSDFFSREDIIEFYKKIDLQIVWRPYKKLLSNPLKIVNAASFGIPTVALDEPVFKEVEGCYMPVQDLRGLLSAVETLRDYSSTYNDYAKRCMEKADLYHIDEIGKLYKQLDI